MSNMIRFAQPGDVDGIMRLLHQVNDVHADGRPDLFVHGNTKYSSQQVEALLTDPKMRIFVSVDDAGEVEGHGFCIIQDHASDEHLARIRTLYIDDICVDEGSRGRHIGQSLFEAIKECATQEGFHNVTLNVWSCNERALRFYEKMGLRPFKIGMELLL